MGKYRENEAVLRELSQFVRYPSVSAKIEYSAAHQGCAIWLANHLRPALSVTGVSGGYQGSGAKAVIPAKASAKLDIRLVPGQQPEEIAALLKMHLTRVTPAGVRTNVRPLLSARPVKMSRRQPAMKAAATAYRTTFGDEPVFLRSGGTIPVVGLIQDIQHIPVVLMGFGLPNDHIHGPNERLHLPTFFRGIETSKRFLLEAAKIRRRQEAPA